MEKQTNEVQNGLFLIMVGVAMNIFGRVLIGITRADAASLSPLGLILVTWMLVSVSLVFYGLYRLFAGLTKKNKPPKDE